MIHQIFKEPPPLFNTWTNIPHSKIGEFNDNLEGARGLIGGYDNDLLFIAHFPKNMQVIDLKTMQNMSQVQNATLPKEEYEFGVEHCAFVPLTIGDEPVTNHYILFCHSTGLLIKFDEKNRAFQYDTLPTCKALRNFTFYSFFHLYDFLFVCGGMSSTDKKKSKNIWKFAMKKKTWSECSVTLPIESSSTCAIMNHDYTYAHVIGGTNSAEKRQKIHIRINMEELLEKSELLQIVQEKMQPRKESCLSIPQSIELGDEQKQEGETDKIGEMPRELEEIEKAMSDIQKGLQMLQHEIHMDWDNVNWNRTDLWGSDGLVSELNKKLNKKTFEIISFLTCVSKLKQNLAEILDRTQQASKQNLKRFQDTQLKLVEKRDMKNSLKKELDNVMRRYVQCVNEWNVLALEVQADDSKQKTDGLMKVLTSTIETNTNLLQRCKESSNKMVTSQQENKERMHEQLKKLKSKWPQWKEHHIAIFIGQTLNSTKRQIHDFCDTVRHNHIDVQSFSKMTEHELATTFHIAEFLDACLVHDSFHLVRYMYPIDGGRPIGMQCIPDVLLCPISRTIMKDPVIVTDGKTYDQASITIDACLHREYASLKSEHVYNSGIAHVVLAVNVGRHHITNRENKENSIKRFLKYIKQNQNKLNLNCKLITIYAKKFKNINNLRDVRNKQNIECSKYKLNKTLSKICEKFMLRIGALNNKQDKC
ncbi:viral A-type inclusion protein [Reticulomyxa filosa]|uniref:Viral A-type inclusion protein n=1 Tax=Reticulomyxa filosa TaxID=46433 RepID=X6LZN0_RETFI|nr:viral A-type inclusion protein [Reticulomyxa filosa]|eukprot:ETO06806.1 viral A-type inclusion protein [Reticulomyxa filosa]